MNSRDDGLGWFLYLQQKQIQIMQYWEIFLGALAAFLLGFAWYTVLFGKAWQAETGISDEAAQSNLGRTHGLAILMMCIICYGINYVINFHDLADQTFTHGAFHGALAALLYAVPAVAIHYLYQKKSLRLFLIDGSFVVAFFAVAGGVMAALKLG